MIIAITNALFNTLCLVNYEILSTDISELKSRYAVVRMK